MTFYESPRDSRAIEWTRASLKKTGRRCEVGGTVSCRWSVSLLLPPYLLRRASATVVIEIRCPIQFHFHIRTGLLTGMPRCLWSRSASSWYEKDWEPPASGSDGVSEVYTGSQTYKKSPKPTRKCTTTTRGRCRLLIIWHWYTPRSNKLVRTWWSSYEGDLLFTDVRTAMEGLAEAQQHQERF